MSSSDFEFEQRQPGLPRSGASCSSCPLSRIPENVWMRLLRPSWARRHPFLVFVFSLVAIFLVCALFSLFRGGNSNEPGEALALVEIKGVINSPEKQIKWINALTRKDNVRGVLVRVDSPGGGAAASQELYTALAALAKKKPVVVSMGSSAASGGLMVSMAAERIFASGTTVTGSIGVRMDVPQIQELAKKLGIGLQTIATAPLKESGSMLRPFSPKERESFERVLKDMHEQFVDIVAAGRHMNREKAAALATGEIFSGREAVARGLVDEIGGIIEAKAWLVKKTGLDEDAKLLRMPKKRSWLQRQIETLFEGQVDAKLSEMLSPAFRF